MERPAIPFLRLHTHDQHQHTSQSQKEDGLCTAAMGGLDQLPTPCMPHPACRSTGCIVVLPQRAALAEEGGRCSCVIAKGACGAWLHAMATRAGRKAGIGRRAAEACSDQRSNDSCDVPHGLLGSMNRSVPGQACLPCSWRLPRCPDTCPWGSAACRGGAAAGQGGGQGWAWGGGSSLNLSRADAARVRAESCHQRKT